MQINTIVNLPSCCPQIASDIASGCTGINLPKLLPVHHMYSKVLDKKILIMHTVSFSVIIPLCKEECFFSKLTIHFQKYDELLD